MFHYVARLVDLPWRLHSGTSNSICEYELIKESVWNVHSMFGVPDQTLPDCVTLLGR